MASEGVAFGIDLGTTFSSIANDFGSQPEVYEDLVTKKQAIPSYVQFQPGNKTIVGWPAFRASRRLPLATIYDAKRMFGAKFTHATFVENQQSWGFKTVSGPDESVLIEVPIGAEKKQFKPYEISAIVLQEFVAIANKSQGCHQSAS
jgi:molecular chaperone DnaK